MADEPLDDAYESPAPDEMDGGEPDDAGGYDGPRLPHNLEAEQALLGGLLLSPQQFDLIEGWITEDDFFSPAYAAVFRAMTALVARGDPLDPLVLRDELAKAGELERVGGAAGLSALTALATTGAHVEHYARIVSDRARLRKLVEAGTEVVRLATAGTESAQAVVDFAEHSVFEIASRGVTSESQSLREVMFDVWKQLTSPAGDDASKDLHTGFADLDEMTTGLHGGELIILAARPSMGKSTFALNLLRNIAIDQGHPAVFYSLEMSKKNLAGNLLAAEAKVDAQLLRRRMLTHEITDRLQLASERFRDAPVWLDETPAISLSEMRGKTRRLKSKHGIRLVIVDYLQLMTASATARNRSREQEVSEISRGLKALAKELDLPVVALSQLRRKPDGRQDARPLLSDLRESGAIEQDADVVMMLHRPAYYKTDSEKSDSEKETEGETELIIAKQRNGPVGTVNLTFINKQLRFTSAALRSQSRPTDDFASD